MLDVLKPEFIALKLNFSSKNRKGKTEFMLVAVNKWLYIFVFFGCWFTEFRALTVVLPNSSWS